MIFSFQGGKLISVKSWVLTTRFMVPGVLVLKDLFSTFRGTAVCDWDLPGIPRAQRNTFYKKEVYTSSKVSSAIVSSVGNEDQRLKEAKTGSKAPSTDTIHGERLRKLIPLKLCDTLHRAGVDTDPGPLNYRWAARMYQKNNPLL